MQLIVHADRCVGHGRCYGVAPDLLSDDEEGYPSVRDRPVEVAAGLEGLARQAAAVCPQAAIELLDA